MKSPFPGMDPYLEAHWGDVHTRLIVYASNQINVCITRATHRTRYELYPISLRASLPNIPIPLRPTDKNVVLRLQPLLDDCYRDGRYDRLDYRANLLPRLEEEDAQWADALLREKGLR